MLAAQLNGKLTRKEEDSEDLLTSNVFGSIKYVPYEEGLIPLFSCAESVDGSNPLNNLVQISNLEYDFWPRLEEEGCNACEPDLLIQITHTSGAKSIVLIEAKYKSGKSSEADDNDTPNDQLAREWDNLCVYATRTNSDPYFLYVTADIGFPISDIEASRLDYLRTRGKNIDILWLSWRKLHAILKSDELIINDLRDILWKQGLTFFEGIFIPNVIRISWGFQKNNIFNFKLKFPEFNWRFISDRRW